MIEDIPTIINEIRESLTHGELSIKLKQSKQFTSQSVIAACKRIMKLCETKKITEIIMEMRDKGLTYSESLVLFELLLRLKKIKSKPLTRRRMIKSYAGVNNDAK